ncbi:inducible metalloproteinase inhibitor protein [Diorhabda carinulata]|uniref:inducible metalloproteinase inhibitor protein n=1 Tax=Diorhabda carinulata TaxID=1163345 RepID=UPI0025A2547B|nr:inducible metalloproteinase inhibitor protein [Diorhabda carinulata]
MNFTVSMCILFAVINFPSIHSDRRCKGPNEHYACGSACQTACETLGEPCPIVNVRCNDDCFCNDGYARDDDGICIPQKKCPPKD